MNTYGLTKEEYIELLKECGMCTKKWTLAKRKEFDKRRLEILENRSKTQKKRFLKVFSLKRKKSK